MRREAGTWLEDALKAGQDVVMFLSGKSVEDYLTNPMLRAAVERKLFIVGEAVVRLRSEFPEVATKIGDVNSIVGFRNMLAHGYFVVEDERVYDIATRSLPTLLVTVARLLDDARGR